MENMEVHEVDIAIIGGGPAGLAAAVYGARSNLKTLAVVGMETTSQLTSTTEVENYIGFSSIQGPELIENMVSQAEKCGAEVVFADVEKVDFSERPFKVFYNYGSDVALAKTVVIATGARARRIDCPGAEEYWNKGHSACAICDSFLAQGNDVAVVGGGDAALEEAMHLTKIASKVYLVHRRDEFRASAAMVKKLDNYPNLVKVMNSIPLGIVGGDEHVTGLKINQEGVEKILDVKAVYSAIGHDPNVSLFAGTGLEIDKKGYIVLKGFQSTATSIDGVFAAGDVADPVYRQAIIAAGSGAKAALDCEHYIRNMN